MQRSLAVAMLVLLALAGCDQPQVPARPPALAPTRTVAHDAGSARLTVGETLGVTFGKVNSSIGDRWFLIAKPDATIVTDGGDSYDADCDQPGCGADLTWIFRAVAPGTTTVQFRYCYRTQPANCEPRPNEPPTVAVSLEITVVA